MVGGEGGSRAMQVRYHLHGEGGGGVPQVPQVQVHWNSLNVHEKYTNSAIFHETRTFSKTVCHFCEFCENDARFPWVEFVDFIKNSLNFNDKRTFSEKGCHFCEFCENDARFPWVEFVDFHKISLNVNEKR